LFQGSPDDPVISKIPPLNWAITPTLTLIGQVDEVVMGAGIGTDDFPNQTAPDFEFEHDIL